MKKIIINSIALIISLNVYAQDRSKVESPKFIENTNFSKGLKSADQVLPKWAIEINYGIGMVQNSIDLKNISTFYTNSFDSHISPITFSGSRMQTADARINYYFNKKRKKGSAFDGLSRKFGISTGINWQQHSGDFNLDTYETQYQSIDFTKQSTAFRQILFNKGAITENVKTNIFNIPLLLLFKHHFTTDKLKKFGVGLETGLLFGFKNQTNFKGGGKFNYEAIYGYDINGNNVLDLTQNVNGNITYLPTSHVLTENYLNVFNGDGTVEKFFNRKNAEGFNVGINKEAKASGTASYTELAFGFKVAPQLFYQLSYNLSFVFSPFFNYQTFTNKPGDAYKLTEKVGEYNSMINGISKNTATSYGATVGFRYYFGEKKDADGDGFIDDKDGCPMNYGAIGGCPDDDGDGIINKNDDCPKEHGDETASGCPDRDADGVKDSEDKCPDEYGEYSGCPAEVIVKNYAKEKNLKIEEKVVEITQPTTAPQPDYVIKEVRKDYINFDFGKTKILATEYDILDAMLATLKKNPDLLILITGYTDDIGNDLSNIKLSKSRALAVSNYLKDGGIEDNRILLYGAGKEKPLTTNGSNEGRATNRRTELKLIKIVKAK